MRPTPPRCVVPPLSSGTGEGSPTRSEVKLEMLGLPSTWGKSYLFSVPRFPPLGIGSPLSHLACILGSLERHQGWSPLSLTLWEVLGGSVSV